MIFLKRKNIARFEKVSFEEFQKRFTKLCINRDVDYDEATPDIVLAEKKSLGELFRVLEEHYNQIIKPARQTPGSAGYDFVAPFDFSLKYGQSITIPTGIKVYIKNGWVLKMYPRSSYGVLGIKIENTVPIIDEDYYGNPKTEGHILLKITNENKNQETIHFNTGDRFAQGTFDIYGLAEEETPKKKRVGGTGSSGSSLFSKQKL